MSISIKPSSCCRAPGFLLLALLAVSTIACAAPLTCPARGGAAWTELTSAHFVLRTDAAQPEAHAMLGQFESLWAVLAYVTGRPQVTEPKIDIVRFTRHRDLLEIKGNRPGLQGYFTRALASELLESQPTMVFSGEELAEEDRDTFLHELTHGFLAERFAALPTWLNEGLAQYYATLRVEPERVVLGETGEYDFSDRPFWWASWRGNAETIQVPAFEAPKVWDLVTADWATFHAERGAGAQSPEDSRREGANYAAAWKLVSYFLNGPDAGDRARFADVMAAIEHGRSAREVFLETFGADLPRLEQSFHRYLTQPQLSRRTVPYRAGLTAFSPVERAMSDAEVHLLWARLLPWEKGSADRARRELDEALASEPGSPEVRYRRGLFFINEARLDEAGHDLEAALAARPDEPRYLLGRLAWYDARAQVAGGTIPSELVDRLARTATSAAQLREAALHVSELGRAEEGLRLIERAIAVDPLCWQCQMTRAGTLATAGRFGEARAAMDRTIALLPEHAAAAEKVFALRRKIELMSRATTPEQRRGPPP